MPRLVQWLLLTDLLLAALYVVDAALGHPSAFAARMVNLDGEGNLPTWYSSAQLLLLAGLLAVFARARLRRDRDAWPLLCLPAFALLLSLDETASIHEWVGRRSDILLLHDGREASLLPVTGPWMFVVGPLVLLALAGLARIIAPSLRTAPKSHRLFVAGLTLLFFSALVVEIASNFVAPGGTGSIVQVLCEELGEMVGATILVWATLELLAVHAAVSWLPAARARSDNSSWTEWGNAVGMPIEK